MRIHELIRDLASFGTLETSQGPKHPTAQSSDFASEIAEFLERFPFVKRDLGYVEFLESYAGLLLWRNSDCLSLSIYGVDPNISLHLTEGEGDIITEEGFLTFADVAVPIEEGRFHPEDPLGAAFGFDATGKRRWGVYRCLSDQPYDWYCKSFENWLEFLVSGRGRWLEFQKN